MEQVKNSKKFSLFSLYVHIWKINEREFQKYLLHFSTYLVKEGDSVIPADVKTPDNKFARIIKPGRNMPAVKTPDKKFA